jgi:hypothetical protein
MYPFIGGIGALAPRSDETGRDLAFAPGLMLSSTADMHPAFPDSGCLTGHDPAAVGYYIAQL